MYCPNCGSQNQAGTKFCTRCGTNLAAATDALSGSFIVGNAQLDEWMDKLLKKFYAGRRDTITGVGLIAGGLFIMAIMTAAGMPPIPAFWIICWMLIWGAISVASGLGKWFASNEEMKKIDRLTGRAFLPRPAQKHLSQPSGQIADANQGQYSTGPVNFPGSATEQTTRKLEQHKLEQHGYRPPLENQSTHDR